MWQDHSILLGAGLCPRGQGWPCSEVTAASPGQGGLGSSSVTKPCVSRGALALGNPHLGPGGCWGPPSIPSSTAPGCCRETGQEGAPSALGQDQTRCGERGAELGAGEGGRAVPPPPRPCRRKEREASRFPLRSGLWRGCPGSVAPCRSHPAPPPPPTLGAVPPAPARPLRPARARRSPRGRPGAESGPPLRPVWGGPGVGTARPPRGGGVHPAPAPQLDGARCLRTPGGSGRGRVGAPHPSGQRLPVPGPCPVASAARGLQTRSAADPQSGGSRGVAARLLRSMALPLIWKGAENRCC